MIKTTVLITLKPPFLQHQNHPFCYIDTTKLSASTFIAKQPPLRLFQQPLQTPFQLSGQLIFTHIQKFYGKND
jgi:hypothetical protein